MHGINICMFYYYEANFYHVIKMPVNFLIKVGLSPSKKNLRYLLHWEPFKSDEKCLLFHLFVLKIFKSLS